MLKCVGIKGGKYLLEEDEEGAALDFQGPDAHRFEQYNRPTDPTHKILFNLEVEYIYSELKGFLPDRIN